MVEGAAAFAAWLGASFVVLSDGRRGLALGLALTAVGVFGVAFQADGGAVEAGAVALLAGGVAAALLRWRSGPAGWGVMPPGSTARLILCVASAIFGLWIAAAVMTGAGAPMRFVALVALTMMGVRVITGAGAAVALSAVAVIALVLAATSGLSDNPLDVAPFLAGAVVAALITALPAREPDAG